MNVLSNALIDYTLYKVVVFYTGDINCILFHTCNKLSSKIDLIQSLHKTVLQYHNSEAYGIDYTSQVT